jgi:hypothetical protein
MTRIKKGILTLVSLSLVLIYCLINDPSRDITLTLGLYAGSSWDVPNGESYQVIDQAIKKFEKKYPNVHVEYKSGIIKDDYSSWLANEITKGTTPDVFMVLPDDFNTLSSIGILKNLDRLIKEERIDTSLFYQSALFAGLEQVKPGVRLSDISHAIEEYLTKNGCTTPRDYTGHGIGTNVHEDPAVPNYGAPGRGPRLKKGMCLAIEPMAHLGAKETVTLDDGWTVITKDHSLAAHYEHTIVITDDGYRILTKL